MTKILPSDIFDCKSLNNDLTSAINDLISIGNDLSKVKKDKKYRCPNCGATKLEVNICEYCGT